MSLSVNMRMRKSMLLPLLLAGSISGATPPLSFFERLADSAYILTLQPVSYDPTYFRIPYPNGDVPANKGVCTDVVIRAYRKLGIDLQREVHVDMEAHFELYPKCWGLQKTDPHIDHRRVPNLMRFFERHGKVKPVANRPSDYSPGDIVCWDLGGGLKHIGILSRKKSADGQRFLVIHNIGYGQVQEDCLFQYKVIGHYSYAKQM